jgi:hypothetical protein
VFLYRKRTAEKSSSNLSDQTARHLAVHVSLSSHLHTVKDPTPPSPKAQDVDGSQSSPNSREQKIASGSPAATLPCQRFSRQNSGSAKLIVVQRSAYITRSDSFVKTFLSTSKPKAQKPKTPENPKT